MSDIKQSTTWAQYFSKMGWKVVKLNQNYLYIKKLLFFGSYIRIPRPNPPLDLKEIDRIARENKALIVKITPKTKLNSKNAEVLEKQLLENGYKKDFWTNTVSKTIILDLTKDKNQLLKSFPSKTRYYIKQAQKKLKVVKLDDIDLFYKLYTQTAKRHKFKMESFQSIKVKYEVFKKSKKALLLFACIKSEPIAAILLLFHAQDVLYAYAATSEKFRQLNAARLLVWEAILKSKKMGYKKFDFDGIADKRFKNYRIWLGATFLKKGFRGEEITYQGSFLKTYNPVIRYLLNYMN